MLKLITVILALLVSYPADPDTEWVLLKEHDKFTVYYRELEDNKLQELKIVAETEAGIAEVVAALETVDDHKEWVYATEESFILNKRSFDSFDYYVSIAMPFPVKDRDIVINYSRQREGNTVHIHSKARKGVKEKRDGYIRINNFESHYYLTPIENNKVQIEYIVRVDPGGKLPAWLVNMLQVHGPTKTMETLLDHLSEGKYSDAIVEGLN